MQRSRARTPHANKGQLIKAAPRSSTHWRELTMNNRRARALARIALGLLTVLLHLAVNAHAFGGTSAPTSAPTGAYACTSCSAICVLQCAACIPHRIRTLMFTSARRTASFPRTPAACPRYCIHPVITSNNTGTFGQSVLHWKPFAYKRWQGCVPLVLVGLSPDTWPVTRG